MMHRQCRPQENHRAPRMPAGTAGRLAGWLALVHSQAGCWPMAARGVSRWKDVECLESGGWQTCAFHIAGLLLAAHPPLPAALAFIRHWDSTLLSTRAGVLGHRLIQAECSVLRVQAVKHWRCGWGPVALCHCGVRERELCCCAGAGAGAGACAGVSA